MTYKFENLKVWQEAMDFTSVIHSLTRGSSQEKLYILNSQIRRTADSIALNIAEDLTGE